MAVQVHIGNVGTIFQTTILDQNGVAVDVSAASVLTLRFRLRSVPATVYAQTAALVGTGTDGKIKYTTVAATFLHTAGDWDVQSYIKIGTTEFWSDIHPFTVFANI